MKNWVNQRWEKLRLSESRYSLYDGSVCNYPIVASGEGLTRNGQPFYIVGVGLTAQKWGSYYCTPSQAAMDKFLAELAASGINVVRVMGLEASWGLAPSGEFTGRPVQPFNNGDKEWTSGGSVISGNTRCYREGSPNRIGRVYQCITSGTNGSTPLTSESADFTNGGTAHWQYLRRMDTLWDETFFVGANGAAGFDYFVDSCYRHGIYILFGINQLGWQYIANGAPTPLGQYDVYQGLTWMDGTGITPANIKGIRQDFITTLFTRVNTVNSRVYGEDYTFFAFDAFNEQGTFKLYWGNFNGYPSIPNGNSFDYMCYIGGTADAAYVTALDAKFVAWHNATYGGNPTVGGVSSSTIPCKNWAGAMGSGVAARDFLNASINMTATEKYRVVEFWEYLDYDVLTEDKTFVKTLFPHCLYVSGQNGYVGLKGLQATEVLDHHTYRSTTQTGGNTGSLSGCDWTWNSGTGELYVNDWVRTDGGPALTLTVGVPLQVTVSSFVQVVNITETDGTTYFKAISSNPGAASGSDNLTCLIPSTAEAGTWMAYNPPGNNVTADTRTHLSINGVWDDTFDMVMRGTTTFSGNLGGFAYNGILSYKDKPGWCSEMGHWGHGTVAHTEHTLLTAVYDALSGRSGIVWFAVVAASEAPAPGGYFWQSFPSNWMNSEIIRLMNKHGGIPQLTTTNHAVTTEPIVLAARANSTIWPVTPSWDDLVTSPSYHAFIHVKTRFSIGGTEVKPSGTYPNLSSTGGLQIPGQANPATCWHYHDRNLGNHIIETPTMFLAFGRLPGVQESRTRLHWRIHEIDEASPKYWYGVIAWMSVDGSPLGASGSKSRLYTYCYSRSEDQTFATVTKDLIYNIYQGNNQTGLQMRQGLRIRLKNADPSLKAYYLQRSRDENDPNPQNMRMQHPVFHKTGEMWIHPNQARIFIE